MGRGWLLEAAGCSCSPDQIPIKDTVPIETPKADPADRNQCDKMPKFAMEKQKERKTVHIPLVFLGVTYYVVAVVDLSEDG